MFCKRCGAEIKDEASFCPSCGSAQQETAATVQPQQQAQAAPQPAPVQATPAANGDAPSTGFAVLCFFFPLIGLILYLVWKDEMPLKAKSCGKGALIGVIVNAVSGVIGGIFYGIVLAGVIGGSMGGIYESLSLALMLL